MAWNRPKASTVWGFLRKYLYICKPRIYLLIYCRLQMRYDMIRWFNFPRIGPVAVFSSSVHSFLNPNRELHIWSSNSAESGRWAAYVFCCVLMFVAQKKWESEREKLGRTRECNLCFGVWWKATVAAGWLNAWLSALFIFYFSFSVFFPLSLHVQLLSCTGAKCCLQAYCVQNRKKETQPADRRKSANAAHLKSMTSLDSH